MVTISCVTIRNGKPPVIPGRGQNGGGIYGSGTLTLLSCVVESSQSQAGGGIYVKNAVLTVVDSTIRLNSVLPAGSGGGIGAEGSSDLTITRSTIRENTASYGGGLFTLGGSLKIANSTVSINEADIDGGGIFASAVTNSLYNVTVAGNGIDADHDGTGRGGGIYALSATVTLSNSVLANVNHSTREADDLFASSGSFVSNGYNIILAPGSASITGAYAQVAPLLGAMTNYGGLTTTPIPLANSPVINTGNPGGCTDSVGATLTTDQRGVKRPIAVRCDLGSVELEPKGDGNGDGVVAVSDVFYLINDLFAGGPAPV